MTETPAGARPMLVDVDQLVWPGRHQPVFAANGIVDQLTDYARLLDPRPARVVLMPEQPCQDLLDLAASQEIAVVWRAGERSSSLVLAT